MPGKINFLTWFALGSSIVINAILIRDIYQEFLTIQYFQEKVKDGLFDQSLFQEILILTIVYYFLVIIVFETSVFLVLPAGQRLTRIGLEKLASRIKRGRNVAKKL